MVEFPNEWIIKGSQAPPPLVPQAHPAYTSTFMAEMEADLNRLILLCWDGTKLNEEQRRQFRKWLQYSKGQWVFITLLNQFRIKNVHSIASEQAFNSISDLLRLALDEICNSGDTYVAVNCILLCSTFYWNPASIGGVNHKRFLYEHIADHKLWRDNDFWERAITCKGPPCTHYPCRANPEGPQHPHGPAAGVRPLGERAAAGDMGAVARGGEGDAGERGGLRDPLLPAARDADLQPGQEHDQVARQEDHGHHDLLPRQLPPIHACKRVPR